MGIGGKFGQKYDLYDENYQYIDSYNWYKTEDVSQMQLEIGLMGRWNYLYGQGMFRIVNFNELTFALSAGFILEDF